MGGTTAIVVTLTAYDGQSTVLKALEVFPFILLRTQWVWYILYVPFTGEKTEAWRGSSSSPKVTQLVSGEVWIGK